MTVCFFCQKKLSFMEETIGDCKCKQFFCKKHRFPEEHQCTFDYKHEQREKLKETMCVVSVRKVQHI